MSEDKNISSEQKTEARRDFIKKAAYIAPVIMTMNAMPSLAQAGSDAAGGTPPSGGDTKCDTTNPNYPNC